MLRLPLKISPLLNQLLETEKQKKGISKNKLINEIVKNYLKNFEKFKE